jgi:hypothetical protein
MTTFRKQKYNQQTTIYPCRNTVIVSSIDAKRHSSSYHYSASLSLYVCASWW